MATRKPTGKHQNRPENAQTDRKKRILDLILEYPNIFVNYCPLQIIKLSLWNKLKIQECFVNLQNIKEYSQIKTVKSDVRFSEF